MGAGRGLGQLPEDSGTLGSAAQLRSAWKEALARQYRGLPEMLSGSATSPSGLPSAAAARRGAGRCCRSAAAAVVASFVNVLCGQMGEGYVRLGSRMMQAWQQDEGVQAWRKKRGRRKGAVRAAEDNLGARGHVESTRFEGGSEQRDCGRGSSGTWVQGRVVQGERGEARAAKEEAGSGRGSSVSRVQKDRSKACAVKEEAGSGTGSSGTSELLK